MASIHAAWAEHMGASIIDTADPAQRMARINAAIGQRRLLLVLDDAWQAEPLVHLKATGPNVAQILTTRDRAIARGFAGAAQEVTVPVLAEAPSHALLRTLAPEAWAADPAAAASLADRVGGLPLALELLGSYLAEPERSAFPELSEAVFAELADPAARLQLASVRLGSVTGERQTLAETTALSLDELAVVVPAAVAAFHALGAFAPKPARFDLAAAKVVTEADAATLALLISRSLLEQEGDGLALHQTLSDVASTHTSKGMTQRHRAHYLDPLQSDRDAWRRFEETYAQISFAWDRLDERSADLFSFIDTVKFFQSRRGLWSDELDWLQCALEAARFLEDTGAEARLRSDFGYVHDALGDKQQALVFYNQALPLQREVGDKGGEATTLNNMAVVAYRDGQVDEAIGYFRQVIHLFHALGAVAEEAAVKANLAQLLKLTGGDQAEMIELTRSSIALLDSRNLPQDAMGQTIDQKRAFLAELTGEAPSQQEDGPSFDQLLDLVAQARGGDPQLGKQLHNAMHALAADAGQPAELRALARVLVRILAGDGDPDLAGLSAELQETVRGLLARLAVS